jgi:[ribosomal protein S5]-alanine N-acetyltransferase
MELKINVRSDVYLSPVREADKTAVTEYLSDRDIHLNTLTIPYPYTEADAEMWIRKRLEHTQRVGHVVSFVIRNADGKVIGGVGADNLDPNADYKAEIGYWLAKPYWGTGIMTDALNAFIEYAFAKFDLRKLVAHVFELNTGSARVLEKNGFKLEGHLRKHYLKNGEMVDARAYGLLKEDRT